jgi:hypothetical protein
MNLKNRAKQTSPANKRIAVIIALTIVSQGLPKGMPEGGSLPRMATEPLTDKACPVNPRTGLASGSNSHPSKMKGCRVKMERETGPGGLIMAGLWINRDGLNTIKHQKIYHGQDYWFCFDRSGRYNAYMDRLHVYKEGKGRRRRAPANIS